MATHSRASGGAAQRTQERAHAASRAARRGPSSARPRCSPAEGRRRASQQLPSVAAPSPRPGGSGGSCRGLRVTQWLCRAHSAPAVPSAQRGLPHDHSGLPWPCMCGRVPLRHRRQYRPPPRARTTTPLPPSLPAHASIARHCCLQGAGGASRSCARTGTREKEEGATPDKRCARRWSPRRSPGRAANREAAPPRCIHAHARTHRTPPCACAACGRTSSSWRDVQRQRRRQRRSKRWLRRLCAGVARAAGGSGSQRRELLEK